MAITLRRAKSSPGNQMPDRADLRPTPNAFDALTLYWARCPIPIIDDEGDGALFPDGRRASTCTSWAGYAVRLYGVRAKIFGFFKEDNASSLIAEVEGGHDFAVLDDRFIIDGWLPESGWPIYAERGIQLRPVYDMADPAHARDIALLYGDVSKWENMASLEAELLAETAEHRAMYMQGVRAPDEGVEAAVAPQPLLLSCGHGI